VSLGRKSFDSYYCELKDNSIVKNKIQMGPNFISPESGKKIACVYGQKINKFGLKKGPYDPLKTA